MATRDRILLLARCVPRFGLHTQQHIMLICAREDCVIKMSNAQGTSSNTGVLTSGLAV